MEVKWTKEQLEAISERGCNLLVAAAAGAGKTAVLVERIIKRITDVQNPVDIDRLLVVTFTNAAATEMRERIGDAIEKALEKKPESRQLQRQLTLLNKASITTIHSFCMEVIKNNFHCSDIDPNFRIADETETVLMKMEALEELFEDKYEEENPDPDFLRLVECYGGSRDDRMLQDMVLTLYEFVQSHPWPRKWLTEKAEAFNLPEQADFGTTQWARALTDSVKIEIAGLLSSMQRAVSIINGTRGLEPYLECFNGDISNIEALLDKCGGKWDDLYEGFSTLEFGKLSRCGRDVDKTKQEQVKGIRDEVKRRLRKIRDGVIALPSSKIIKDLRDLYPMIKCLANLVLEFDGRYAAKKKEKSILDFNDLEHFCLEILTDVDDRGEIVPSRVALDYRERFEEILVDEYQDGNLVQEVIISTISRKDSDSPNVFAVGDVKQSIYRFRQARPELFLEKYNTYSKHAGSRNRKIQLYKNFRSRENIIKAVNFVFSQIMSRNIGELDYNEDEALNLGAVYQPLEDRDAVSGGETELHIVDMNDNSVLYEMQEEDASGEIPEDITGDQDEEPDAVRSEAIIVAKRIKELVEPSGGGRVFKVFDKKLNSYRKVEYRDIVVLLRTTKNWAEAFMEEFGSQGIPAYADTGTGYFQTTEIQVMMSLLQVIDNPMQDIPMLAVLRSPIVSFTPEELIDIRLCNREVTFYQAMRIFAAEGEGTAAEKTGKFLERLDDWRDKAQYMSTDQLIWYLYADTGYYSYAGAMPGGVQRQANLRILFERARQYEETSFKGLFNFINFINRLKGSSGDMGSAKILGENENVVRIMSIHKSKGLEFPVVIVSGCGKKFNFQDMSRSILLHQDLGFGPDYVDPQRRVSYSTVPKQALKYKIKLETLSEEMRILYVAFTRAREKLIITGSVKDVQKTAERWKKFIRVPSAKLPEYEMMSAASYLDWIGPALIRHRDGEVLRSAAGSREDSRESCVEDGSSWSVRLWSKRDVLAEKASIDRKEESLIQDTEDIELSCEFSPYREEIEKRLNWNYPYRMSARLPVKISVTELKRRLNMEFSEEYMPAQIFTRTLVKKPSFLEETRGFSAAEKGTILHFVMQHLDLNRVSSIGEIREQVMEMVSRELLTEQEAEAVDVERIDGFFRSPIGMIMVKADVVKREVPFNLELRSTEIYKDLPEEVYGNETVLLQGVIDCYFEEGGNIVLLDYKTDYVPEGGTDIIREKYRIQIEHYTRALERITGRKVNERYIYLFWNGEIVEY